MSGLDRDDPDPGAPRSASTSAPPHDRRTETSPPDPASPGPPADPDPDTNPPDSRPAGPPTVGDAAPGSDSTPRSDSSPDPELSSEPRHDSDSDSDSDDSDSDADADSGRGAKASLQADPPPDTSPAVEFTRRLSSRDHQAHVEFLKSLSKTLVELSPPKLAALDLDPELDAAVTGARGMRKGARNRELRRISTLLRRHDPDALRSSIDALSAPDVAERQRLHWCESWRDKLLEGGDAALSELLQTHAHADRQRLRQLIRTARGDRTRGKSQHAYRELFRELRELDPSPPD